MHPPVSPVFIQTQQLTAFETFMNDDDAFNWTLFGSLARPVTPLLPIVHYYLHPGRGCYPVFQKSLTMRDDIFLFTKHKNKKLTTFFPHHSSPHTTISSWQIPTTRCNNYPRNYHVPTTSWINTQTLYFCCAIATLSITKKKPVHVPPSDKIFLQSASFINIKHILPAKPTPTQYTSINRQSLRKLSISSRLHLLTSIASLQ